MIGDCTDFIIFSGPHLGVKRSSGSSMCNCKLGTNRPRQARSYIPYGAKFSRGTIFAE